MLMFHRHRRPATLASLLLAGALGCSPASIVGEGELPPGVGDPKDSETPAGALRAYRSALVTMRVGLAGSYGSYLLTSGLLSDEMQSTKGSYYRDQELLDRRILQEYTDIKSEERIFPQYSTYQAAYNALHKIRAQARVGTWLLEHFAPQESPALAAHLRAVEAFADIYLADLFCSGIPLSTVDPEGYTLQPGSNRDDVYLHAIGLLDSALAGATDSARVVNFASLGKGRALLALGQYVQAAQAVAQVPDGFQYQLQFIPTYTDQNGQENSDASNFMAGLYNQYFGSQGQMDMSDAEGTNGIDWISSGDPRTDAIGYPDGFGGPDPVFLPTRLALDGSSPIAIADWREARLIEAEAALQGGSPATFLTLLNDLRQQTIFPPAQGDTTFTARILPPLSDPGTPDARVDLLFRERAFWLHLTGHRQGDLRRLIRQYGRDASTVYPVGRHPGGGGAYGGDVNAPVPSNERRYNARFTGCIDRGA